ncbi:MAG: EAL domain-containing protein [Pegethrix bostrychoides GSE-TBD4-15B]|jgi:diguanylate cyclase (GGDEF)-like protein|uniref:EAL domain-containing protein n=1 Tax=Pegethrix bostrychoides GSE-TBD4-15B TaxID=2839662 RepID=A0A951PED5_9CYAN|nr:EAL domain-containing protein [Pegethrix bostrychoides GSE-TBD4-15B]
MPNNRGVSIRNLPLSFLLVVPFVMQIFVVVSLTGWISLRNGQKAVNDLASQLRNEVAARIQQKLSDHLRIAPLVNQVNVDALRLGMLDLDNQKLIQQQLAAQLRQFSQLSGITLATETPSYAGIAYDEEGRRILSLWNPEGGLTDSILDAQDQIVSQTVDAKYDHRRRPWYQTAVKAGRSVWQEPYVTINPQRLVISADQPFYDAQGQLLGVADAELTLTSISEFLSEIHVGKTGQTFIIERNGTLVATSTPQQPFRLDPKTQEPERLLATQSSDLLVSQTAQFLGQTFRRLDQINAPQQLEFELAGERQFLQVMPFQDQQGLDWLVVVTVPEADFMETINANTRTTVWLCLGALAVSTLIGLWTAQRLVRPISGVISAADALSKGHWNQHLPPSRFGELALLAGAFNHMAEQLQLSFNALQYNAHHDPLTGLLNQTAFRLQLREAIARRDYFLSQSSDWSSDWSSQQSSQQIGQQASQQSSYCFAILFLDLDYFKLVNDSLGHLIGDQLLVAVTQRLQAIVIKHQAIADRLADNNVIARFGGDEFVILLDPIQDIQDATQLANQISHELQKPFNISGNEVFISTSIGIVISTNGGAQPESFLRNADIALYRAKANGKASYELFDAVMHTQAVTRLQLETDLRRAIEQQELKIYYQPIIEIHSCRIAGFEALLRWHHPTQGWVSPAEFIPIAEETGLIVRLGEWVLHQACVQMQRWQQQFAGCAALTLSVNLSSRQFFQADFLESLEQTLARTGLSPENLKLEITESIFINTGEATKAKLRRIKQFGVQLSIDDFGTGYSSLSYLHRFPIDTLKIDRSFIQRLQPTQDNLEIVEAIVVLAHKLGMTTVAEGVETATQLQLLRQIGCEQIQGFLFSRPVEASKIAAMLIGGTTLPPETSQKRRNLTQC